MRRCYTPADDGQDRGIDDVTIGQQLTAEQQAAIYALLTEHTDVFSATPGYITLVEHVIATTDDKPIFQPSYEENRAPCPILLLNHWKTSWNKWRQTGLSDMIPTINKIIR